MTVDELITLKISNGALKGAQLPTRLKVLAWGANESTQGTYTAGDKTSKTLTVNQRALGYERVAIDFDHCSVSTTESHKALLKAGQPPLIFGYGTVNPISGDGIYLEDITWTPLGIQHARNFEDISPAIKDDAGEVVLIHSVALTPNGSVHGLQFFSSTQPNNNKPIMDDKLISLADLAGMVGLDANADKAAVTAELKKRLLTSSPTTLSVELATALKDLLKPLSTQLSALETKLADSEKAGVDLKRGELVTLFAKDGKTPKKVDGTAYSADELKALSLDTLQLLHANTPVTVPLSARNGVRPEGGRKSFKDDKGQVDLAALFDAENARAGLSLVPPDNLN